MIPDHTHLVVRGVPLELHPEPDYVSDHIRRTRDFYEIDILHAIADRLEDSEPGVVVDVGAMIGNHTAYMAEFVRHTWIYAFEPAPLNLPLLRRNVERYPDVTVVPVALSDHAGKVQMAIADDNRGWATVKATEPNLVPEMHPFTAQCRTLDSYHLADVRLIKIDVEHHERAVLAGARDTIERCRPIIVIEDWPRVGYPDLLPGYGVTADWGDAHQTYLYSPLDKPIPVG